MKKQKSPAKSPKMAALVWVMKTMATVKNIVKNKYEYFLTFACFELAEGFISIRKNDKAIKNDGKR